MAMFMRCMVIVACIVLVVESSSPGWLERSIRSIEKRRNRRMHKNIHSNEIVDNHHHNHDTTGSQKGYRMTDCCYNGGLCIMNTFCHCPQGYHGQFCEHKTRDRACGTIEHGTWMARGCFLCHCFDGRMRCKTTRIPNCEFMPFVQAKEELPDYQVDVDKKFADYERFYDMADEEITNTSTSGSGTPLVVFPICSKFLLASVVSVFIRWFSP